VQAIPRRPRISIKRSDASLKSAMGLCQRPQIGGISLCQGPSFERDSQTLVELAEHILETKAGHFDPAEFEDRYETAVVEMLKQKQAGMPVRKEAPVAAPSTVVNLMDALKRSIQQERGEKKGKVAEKVSRQSGKRKAG
jgi:non-homologous end joining protein Ku